MKILVAPTLYIKTTHHFTWLKKSIASLKKSDIDFDLVGFANYLGGGYMSEITPMFDSIHNNERNNVSDSWNRAIQYGIDNKYDYTIIPNLDINVREYTISNLVKFAEENDGVMWSGYCTNRTYDLKPDESYKVHPVGMNNYDTYAFYMVNDKLFDRVGKFDNHYQAYCEDVDMEQRIHLAGQTHWCVKEAPFFHAENVTLNGLRETGEDLQFREQHNGALAYFLEKWGNYPREKLFDSPFNNPNLSYKDI
jgi:hypothetical protein